MASRFSIESVFKAIDKVSAPVSRMQSNISKSMRTSTASVKKLDRQVDKLSGSLISGAKTATAFGIVGIGAVAGAVALLVKEFSKIEDAEAAFTPLLGGAKKAKKLVDELNKTAASTPFQFTNLSDTANPLLPVMNGNIEKTIKTLRMLGDTSGGNAQKLESITRGFTKAMLKGKVDLESLNMIGEAGVPIFQELAKTMGVKVDAAFFKMISAGKVTTKELTKTFETMTAKGGLFFGGMEIASKTTTGLFSTLKDNISLTAAEIGGVLSPVIKDLLKQATGTARSVREWVIANKSLISEKFIKFVETVKIVIKNLVTGISELNTKHSIVDRFISGIESLSDAFGFLSENGKTIAIVTGSILALSLVLKTVIGVMAVFNIIMAMNPIGLMVIGVAALIAGITALVVWIDEIAEGFDSLPGIVQAVLAPIGILIDSIKWIKDNIGAITDISMPSMGDIGIPSLGDIGGFLGFGGNDNASSTESKLSPQIISPQERTAKSIEEKRDISTATVTIKDESGKATVTSGALGSNINMESSGSF